MKEKDSVENKYIKEIMEYYNKIKHFNPEIMYNFANPVIITKTLQKYDSKTISANGKAFAGESRENKMGVMSEGKLLMSMSLPMIISMLFQAMYNVVDSVFVSRFSMDGLTAVSTAFPIQNLMIGVFSGLGVGFNAFISKALGEKKFDRANEVARQGIFLEAIGYGYFIKGFLLAEFFQ